MLTAAHVAAQLGLSLSKVYDLAKTGQLPCYRFGGALRFEPADVERFKAACRMDRAAPTIRQPSVHLATTGVGAPSKLQQYFRAAGLAPRPTRKSRG